jgi:hypothetical protein
LESSAGSAEQKFTATAQANSNLPTTGAHDHFVTAGHVRVLPAFSLRKISQPIAIAIRFASLVLFDEEYNQEEFAQLACTRGNRARRSGAAIRS